MKTVHVRLLVRGKVQGVFFRKSMREVALRLGIVGTVENLPDGSVLVHAQGPETQVRNLAEWCRQGPPIAVVSSVEATDVPVADYASFTISR